MLNCAETNHRVKHSIDVHAAKRASSSGSGAVAVAVQFRASGGQRPPKDATSFEPSLTSFVTTPVHSARPMGARSSFSPTFLRAGSLATPRRKKVGSSTRSRSRWCSRFRPSRRRRPSTEGLSACRHRVRRRRTSGRRSRRPLPRSGVPSRRTRPGR
jgi:hypothetical protein